jgi:hypothetical protein
MGTLHGATAPSGTRSAFPAAGTGGISQTHCESDESNGLTLSRGCFFSRTPYNIGTRSGPIGQLVRYCSIGSAGCLVEPTGQPGAKWVARGWRRSSRPGRVKRRCSYSVGSVPCACTSGLVKRGLDQAVT